MTVSIWVGKLEDKLYVFDPELQLVDCPHVFLWDSTLEEMKKFVPALARKTFQSTRDSRESNAAIDRYLHWKPQQAAAWLEEERRYYDARQRSEQSRNTEAKLRFTHCYKCKRELISDEDQCNMCGWVKCSCGACGCRYSGRSERGGEA